MSVKTAVAAGAPKAATKSIRFWEGDVMRGGAIVLMVIYHLLWDLWLFQVLPNIVLYDGFWKYFQRYIATSFILLVGVSLTLSYRQALRRRKGNASLFPKFLKRGLMIFGWGMVISAVVWAAGIGYMHFGVLHLIGFSIIAAYPLIRYRWPNFFLWMALFVGGYFLQGPTVDFTWLVWLGFKPPHYYPLDYFPVIPWFGVVLLGVFVGNTLYDADGRRFFLPDWSAFPPFRLLEFLGRHSLVIYLIHQPILFAILFALGIAHF